MLTANASHEPFVNFPNEADRNWEGREALQAVIHGSNIIEHLVNIVRLLWIEYLGLKFQHVIEGGLRAFNLAR